MPGSSPHARGALGCDSFDVRLRGIIPACAGSTDASFGYLVLFRDHPRMRGEHADVAWVITEAVGSSPHARGALDLYFLRLCL